MSEITALTDIGQIRLRASQHIGDTENPNQLLREVIDNAEDEVFNGYANTIEIDINDDVAIITDNGRGIPTEEIDVELINGETIRMDGVVASLTIAKTSGKYTHDTYSFSKGMHGVGLAAVNALSEYVKVITKERVNNTLFSCYYFKNGKLESKKQINNTTFKFSTYIEIKPDKEYFTSTKFIIDDNFIKNLIFVKSKLNNNIKYILNNEEIKYIPFDDIYVRELLNINSNDSVIHKTSATIDEETLDIYYTYDINNTSDSGKILGDVNLILCDGKYLTTCKSYFINKIYDKYSSKFNNSKDKIWLSSFLHMYVSYKCKKPEFDAQVKNNMKKNASYIIDLLNFGEFINTHECKDIVEKIIEYKSKKKIKKVLKNNIEDSDTLHSEQNPGDILYIVEGGPSKVKRNPLTDGVFPLGGKINNPFARKTSDLLKSIKFKNFARAVGLGSSVYDNNYRYDKYLILTDADIDGVHISCLVAAHFLKYAPDKIEQGKVGRIILPLYGCIKNNEFIPVYDENDLEKYKNDYKIKRFKGIGSMDPDHLTHIIRDPKIYTFRLPRNNESYELVVQILSESYIKKVLSKNYNFGYDIFMNEFLKNN
jgi:DNA gyrase/topoisomerase IV subunit B